MTRLVLLALSVCLAGCQNAQTINRETLDQLYADSALAPGVLSSVPIEIDAQADPVVVNWWYAGSDDGYHELVLRELTRDATGRPVGDESRYRVPVSQLTIDQPFDKTRDEARWLPLYEVSPDFIPPADLPTRRRLPDTVDPIRVDPQTIDPELLGELER